MFLRATKKIYLIGNLLAEAQQKLFEVKRGGKSAAFGVSGAEPKGKQTEATLNLNPDHVFKFYFYSPTSVNVRYPLGKPQGVQRITHIQAKFRSRVSCVLRPSRATPRGFCVA